MPHLDDDALAVLALGEEPEAHVTAHLVGCDRCRSELQQLGRVVTAGRANAVSAGQLTPPPAHVWAGIAAAVGEEAGEQQRTVSGALPGASVTDLHPRTERRKFPSWLAVAAGVAIGVSGTAAFQALDPGGTATPEDDLIASAQLDELGADGTSGTAEIRGTGDTRVLSLQLADPTGGTGFREVWLLNPDNGELISLGVLNGTTSTFELPDDLDLSDYPAIDVSREPLDGDPTHSADSIARGKLDL